MNLESPKVTVEKSAQELFDLLSDVKNFEKLMPENIAKFEVIGDDAFIFGLKGMPEIKLKMKEPKPVKKTVSHFSVNSAYGGNVFAGDREGGGRVLAA